MTELAVRDETAPARPAATLPVPAMSDVDSWTQIVGQVIKLANEIYDTPFVPDGLRGSSPAVAAAILAGREMGLGPMTSLANIDVIRGKPTQKPLLMRAMVLSRGHKWDDVESTDFRAVVRGRRKDETLWTTVTFTADQAKRAGLDLGKYPADKLYARASSRLAKHKFADVIMGMAYSSDEIEDGLDAEAIVTTGEDAPAAIEPPKPKTAQRAARKPSPPAPAAAAQAAASPAASGPRQDAGGDLPPLPGEDDPPPPDSTDYSTPGTVTKEQLTRIWATLTSEFGFAHNENDIAREACARIAGREVASSKDLSFREAGTVIDALAGYAETARRQGRKPREVLADVIGLATAAPGEPDDPRAAVLARFAELGAAGPEIPGYLTRLSGHSYAGVDALSRKAAQWFTVLLARYGSRDELEAAAVAAETARAQDHAAEAGDSEASDGQ